MVWLRPPGNRSNVALRPHLPHPFPYGRETIHMSTTRYVVPRPARFKSTNSQASQNVTSPSHDPTHWRSTCALSTNPSLHAVRLMIQLRQGRSRLNLSCRIMLLPLASGPHQHRLSRFLLTTKMAIQSLLRARTTISTTSLHTIRSRASPDS